MRQPLSAVSAGRPSPEAVLRICVEELELSDVSLSTAPQSLFPICHTLMLFPFVSLNRTPVFSPTCHTLMLFAFATLS